MLRLVPVIALAMALVGSTDVFAQYDFVYIAPDASVVLAPGEPTTTFDIGFAIWQPVGPMGGTQGFSMGVAHDPTELVVEAIEYGTAVLDDDWGEPDFFGTTALPGGWTAGVVYSFYGGFTIEFPDPGEAVRVTYSTQPGVGIDMVTPLTWTDALGSPPVANGVVVSGATYYSSFDHGSVSFVSPAFIRGDMNGDGTHDISDVFVAEDYLFLGGATPSCLAAVDANGDTLVDIADIIYLLTYMFIGGSAPPAPFPNCGPEPQASATLGCDAYDCP